MLVSLSFVSCAHAAQYMLTITEVSPEIYESESGIVVVSDETCPLRESTAVNLFYRADRKNDYLSYTEDVRVIEDGVEKTISESFTCPVRGVVGLSDYGGLQIPTNLSNPKYDADAGNLYLYNIELWENLGDSGFRIDFARLKFVDGVFHLEEIR